MLRIKTKINRSGDFYKKLSYLKKLDNQSVSVGHFESQGLHSSGKSYVNLMKEHHTGDEITPPRPVLTILNFRLRGYLSSSEAKSLLKRWAKDPKNIDLFLSSLGKKIAQQEKQIFGNNTELASNAPLTQKLKGRDSPLVDTGELRSKVAYRTSIGNKVIEE